MTGILPLTLTGAHVRKHGNAIIGPVDLALGRNGVTIVMGPNGAGKTTLLRLIHGLERLAGGRVDWQVAPREALRRQAFVFQFPILMRRSVLDNIAYPLRLNGAGRAEARAEAEAWGDRVGLSDKLRHPAQVLSGGERQKLALARALIGKPELLLLDEPTSNLDGRSTKEFEALLRNAIDDGTRIIMATHDLGQARRLGDEIAFLHDGRVVEFAPVADFFATPKTPQVRAFLHGDIVE